MLTFEAIMQTVEREDLGVMVKNCAKTSVEEAQAAIKNHPKLMLAIEQTSDAGTCIIIKPKE